MYRPQCQPSAILHLCQACNVSILFYDETYIALAKASAEAANIDSGLTILDVRYSKKSGNLYSTADLQLEEIPSFSTAPYDVAYLRHTSGTSTGLPKPIAHTHHGAVGVLPTFETSDKPTFTTTPLYSGGVSDCFRSWTSGDLIWLFPGKEVAITTPNVLKSLSCAERYACLSKTSPVKYFSSVPYVLQMVAADELGLKALQGMDLVGVGGAALPRDVGDDLVKKGLNLVSRFGSAECGFIMSSQREYSVDKEWQYLRSRKSEFLSFESQEDGLSELVILPTWPHVAKKNREDGSFATADLFEPHPTLMDAWRYHSRVDSQLTLITGKKFDPATLENAISASPVLSDVLIFGNGKQHAGALLFRSNLSTDISEAALLEEIWPLVQKLNAEGQPHTRLSKSMLIIMPTGASALDKSSKGTILRGQAEDKYQSEINRAYHGGLEDAGLDLAPVADRDVTTTILRMFKDLIGSESRITEDADLFSLGVDSVACLQVKASVEKVFQSIKPVISKLICFRSFFLRGRRNCRSMSYTTVEPFNGASCSQWSHYIC